MKNQSYSITRTKATWKPRVCDNDIPFYYCPDCKSIYQGIAGTKKATYSGDGRAPLAELPYHSIENHNCCGISMEPLSFVSVDNLNEKSIAFDYKILGGFNNNAISFSWQCSKEEHHLEWVVLKTFTGIQTKYVLPKKKSPLIFAFAEEDAYAYCDESPCLECVFMCKRGFIFYAYVETIGLIRIPLTRMSPYWESRS